MKATLVIDSDVAAAIERLRRTGLGLSEALNLLARRGMAASGGAPPVPYEHRGAPIGLKIDVTGIADVLEALDRR